MHFNTLQELNGIEPDGSVWENMTKKGVMMNAWSEKAFKAEVWIKESGTKIYANKLM